MLNETVVSVQEERKVARRHYLLSLFVALAFVLTIYPSKANAQIVGDLEANIPFQFHVGNTKLPAGEYRIHVLDDSDLTIMEISSKDGSASALFQVQGVEANNTPTKSELIFNRYGNHYFLAQLFDQGEPSGSQVPESRYEKAMSKEPMQAQEHVPAHGRTQRGS